MRSDVPVGGYLSGGLDSSITCALAAKASPHKLRSFSVAFEDPRFDESAFQQLVAAGVGSEHLVQHIGTDEIAEVFPAVVRHAETPLVRTAPAPMYLLAKRTREAGIKVVLTGEGADELFLGYDLFKETLVRLFCMRQPSSKMRPRLFDRLYPYLAQGGRAGEFWRNSFLTASRTSDPLFSHMPRFLLAARIKDFYSTETRIELAGADPLAELRQALPGGFMQWSPVNRAAYLELTVLLPSYLLSSQGDRMASAHGVEGRFPFLDHRLFEFAASLPTDSKLRGLREKHILRRWAEGVVPSQVNQRPKQPYRAPDAPAFFGRRAPDYVREMLSPEVVRRIGIFDPIAVAGLVRRCAAGLATGFGENQALVAVLSTHLWHHEFMVSRSAPAPVDYVPSDAPLRGVIAVSDEPHSLRYHHVA
jgi:asparagine synthase (glutamine-hydrolysing)